MKWSEEKVGQLKTLAQAGASNKEIATQLGVSVTHVYAKRSQLGITIDKVKATKAATINPEFDALFPKTEMKEAPKLSKFQADEIKLKNELAANQGLIRLLKPAILKADPSIKSLEVIDSGRLICIKYGNDARRYVDIQGDSLLAIIADVTRVCLK